MPDLRESEWSVDAKDAQKSPGGAPALKLDVASLSHIGLVRETNEDAYVVVRTGRYMERIESNLPESLVAPRTEESAHILMVADGMGGMAAGEVASRTALATAVRLILHAPRWALKLDDPATRETEIAQMWERARGYLSGIHAAIREQAERDPSLAGMGTTLTGAYCVGHDLFVLHVGDSRAYLFRRNELNKITRDHTIAQEFEDAGMVTSGDQLDDRLRNVLTRAVGGPDDEIEGDLHHLRLAAGDRLMLCSDGLTGMAGEAEIAEILAVARSSEGACQALLDLALERGGRDNITVIVATFTAA